MAVTDPQQMADEISTLLKERLGIRRRAGLKGQLILARTLLPSHVLKAARGVADAARLGAHPKLMKQVDLAQTRADFDLAVRHLREIDPRQRRIGILLGMVTGLLFNLVILALAIVLLLPLMPF